jgi:hypothetical protein
VRALRVALFAVLALSAPGRALASSPPAAWLAQAGCVHGREGPWTANTGNGYFGGMQFSAQTWVRAGGREEPAFAHPGDPAFPFAVSPSEQLYRAWLVWQRDGGTWRSWGAVGQACTRTTVALRPD